MTINETSATSCDQASIDIDTNSSLTDRLLHPQGMSRASDLLPLLPFGSTTLWKWSKDGRFPAPIRLSSTMTAWRNSDVLHWLDEQGGNGRMAIGDSDV